jgi:hypothetical protein
MSKYLLSAAAAAFLMVGATGAFALEQCTGAKVGWTEGTHTVGGATSTTCFQGYSGNEVDCATANPGVSTVTLTDASITYNILTQPGSSSNPQQCWTSIASQTVGSCTTDGPGESPGTLCP